MRPFRFNPHAFWVMQLLCCIATSPCLAQRSEENAVKSADDAFGTTVGGDSIGLYSGDSVRGFSPVVAGNVRVDGLYIDLRSSITSRFISDVNVRIGISAQGHPMPAPTGIVELGLRSSSEAPLLSAIASYEPFGGKGLQLDSQLSLIDHTLTTAVGIAGFQSRFGYGGTGDNYSVGIVPRWKISDHVDVTAFWGHIQFQDEQATPIYVSDGNYLPPQMRRGHWLGPDWARNRNANDNVGVLGRIMVDDWTFRAGVFYSRYKSQQAFINLFEAVTLNRSADRIVLSGPPQGTGSTSGEVRISKTFDSEKSRQTVLLSVRGRKVANRYGGEDLIELGSSNLETPIHSPVPSFTYREETYESINQWSEGISYNYQWKGVAELGLGSQFTHFVRHERQPAEAQTILESREWLPSATLAANLSTHWLAYGSFTRGLEDSSSAPDSSTNRGQPTPAIITRQHDIGIRWVPNDAVKLIAAYFELQKPYFSTDSANYYRQLGSEIHRGIELSLSIVPTKDLTILAGATVSNPRVSGVVATNEVIGSIPIGQPKHVAQLDVDYALPSWTHISIDAGYTYTSKMAATVDNTVYIPAFGVLNLGGRYTSRLSGKPCTLRVQWTNVANTYSWELLSAGTYTQLDQRAFTASVAVDF